MISTATYKKLCGVVSITDGGVVMVDAEKDGARWRVKDHSFTPFESEALDAAVISEAIASSLKEGVELTAITLPDDMARFAVLNFKSLPSNPVEAAKIIGWKAEKEHFAKEGTLKTSFSVISRTDEGVVVLAVSIDSLLLDELESNLDTLGISVPFINTHTLSLINLFSSVLTSDSPFAFVARFTDHFTAALINNSVVSMIRLKEFEGEDEFMNEVKGSLRYFVDILQGKSVDRLYLVNEGGEGVLGELGLEVNSLAASTVAELGGAEAGENGIYLLSALGLLESMLD
ncbi:MAG: hypothetical protein KAR06_08255 [Deltaproteobacteria bacterium]|nr:hypothetical protein [Deltaproteobacteria bacterium]